MKRFFAFLVPFLVVNMAYADIYKYTDANGVVTYTNVKPGSAQKSEVIITGPKIITPDSGATERRNNAKVATPSDFPKVDNRTQQQRDSKRKAILQSELDQEKQALDTARQLYEEAQNTPEVYRNAQGKTFRNVAKYEEKLHVIAAEIQAHERNIELLIKELNQ